MMKTDMSSQHGKIKSLKNFRFNNIIVKRTIFKKKKIIKKDN